MGKAVKRRFRCQVCGKKKPRPFLEHFGNWEYACKGACSDLFVAKRAANKQRKKEINEQIDKLYDDRRWRLFQIEGIDAAIEQLQKEKKGL